MDRLVRVELGREGVMRRKPCGASGKDDTHARDCRQDV
jgi:hypothetical protein